MLRQTRDMLQTEAMLELFEGFFDATAPVGLLSQMHEKGVAFGLNAHTHTSKQYGNERRQRLFTKRTRAGLLCDRRCPWTTWRGKVAIRR